MQANILQPKSVSLRSMLQTELFIASLIPVAAILVIGAAGSGQVAANNVFSFFFMIFLAIIIVFACELGILLLLQRTIKQPIAELIVTCQEYIAGNKARRAIIAGNDELASLAGMLNGILDTVQREQQFITENTRSEQLQADGQMKQLVRELEPVLNGNLDVKAAVTTGTLGMVSDVCNYLIEELVQLVKWTRYSSDQVIGTTGDLLERSIDLAQTAETQMLRLSHTSEAIEKVVAFIQRMSSTLQLSVDIAQEIRVQLQTQKRQSANQGNRNQARNTEEATLVPLQPTPTFLEKLDAETQRQVKLLEDVLQSTQDTVSVAESTIGDIYFFAQRIHQSSTGILKTAERVSTLVGLAEQWRSSIAEFRLPEENTFEGSEGPTPTGAIRRIQ